MVSNDTNQDIAVVLQKAIDSNNTKDIEEIVDSIDNPTESFYECLFAACREGINDFINILLKCKNLELNKKLYFHNVLSKSEIKFNKTVGKAYKTAVLLAAESGKLETVKLLVEKYHANISLTTDKGNTALILAAKNNNLNVVKYLIETKGMVIDDKNMYDDTALTEAADNGSLECVKYLIDKGADVLHKNKNGKTIIFYAAFSNNLACLKTIAESIPQDILKEHINCRSNKSLTALHWAAKKGYIDIVKYLLSKGANPNLKCSWNKTPYQIATNVEIKRLLLEATWVNFVRPSELYE